MEVGLMRAPCRVVAGGDNIRLIRLRNFMHYFGGRGRGHRQLMGWPLTGKRRLRVPHLLVVLHHLPARLGS